MKNDKKDESKTEEPIEKNAPLAVSPEQIRTRASRIDTRKNSKEQLTSSVKFGNDPQSKKNDENSDKKAKKRRRENQPRALTSPGGRTPGLLSPSASPSSSSSPSPRDERAASRSKSDSHICRSDMINVVIKSTISSFKPLKLAMKKTTSIRVLKNYLQSRLSGAHQITLIYNDQELKNESGSLASAGITSGSTLWLLVKPIAGNNDREEIASLIRMSQSLANLRNLIRALPPIDTSEPSFSGSEEYVEVGAFGQKETEHAQMRERMRLLKKRRDEARRTQNSAEKSPMESPQQKSEDELLGNNACRRSFDSPSQSPASPCTSPLSLPAASTLPTGTADVVKHKELGAYFEPPETSRQRKFQSDELFDVPSNQSELIKMNDEIKNKRCNLCRIKLQPADREMRCMCDHVFCSKHRSPQIHRCSIDMKSIDRVHVRTALPKVVQEDPKSKI